MKTTLSILLIFLAFCSKAADLGMQAPPLQVAKWPKGSPTVLKTGLGTNVYVLLFWEIGCPHCVDSMLELSQLQREFGSSGLVVLGICPESAESVSNFVQNAKHPIDFPLAVDDQRKTQKDYMGPGQVGVPYTFIVGREGTILWHRHPAAGLRTAVKEIITGTYDMEAEKRANAAGLLAGQYVNRLKGQSGDFKIESVNAQILADARPNPWLLNNFACDILDLTNAPSSAIDLATRASKMAYEATGKTNSAFADTYAHALFAAGKTSEAIELQKRAIELCTDDRYRAYLKKSLEDYESKGAAPKK